MHYYQIGDIYFYWKNENFPLVQDVFMENFAISKDKLDETKEIITYESRFLEIEKYKELCLLSKNTTYELYKTDKGNLLVYHWAKCRFGFGYWLDDLKNGNKVSCFFHPDMLNQIPLSAVRFFSCAGMHSKLLQHGKMILHASYIDWNGNAIAFTARSGVGKSTQAELWRKYLDAEIINGDRMLLSQKNGVWHSYGYPCCGSSLICINRTLPLKVIVVLEQGKENFVEHLSVSQKIRAIVSGTEMYLWDNMEINMVFELAKELIKEIPIIKLVCKPDADAAFTLKTFLEERENDKSI